LAPAVSNQPSRHLTLPCTCLTMFAVRRLSSFACRSGVQHFQAPRSLMTRAMPCFGTHKGTVKRWTDKGFGFIADEEGNEYFVHFSNIQSDGFKSLAEGEAVEFDLEEDTRKGGHKACNVTGPDGAQVQGAPRPEREEW